MVMYKIIIYTYLYKQFPSPWHLNGIMFGKSLGINDFEKLFCGGWSSSVASLNGGIGYCEVISFSNCKHLICSASYSLSPACRRASIALEKKDKRSSVINCNDNHDVHLHIYI